MRLTRVKTAHSNGLPSVSRKRCSYPHRRSGRPVARSRGHNAGGRLRFHEPRRTSRILRQVGAPQGGVVERGESSRPCSTFASRRSRAWTREPYRLRERCAHSWDARAPHRDLCGKSIPLRMWLFRGGGLALSVLALGLIASTRSFRSKQRCFRIGSSPWSL